ncbi:MAG: hypothetical protein QM582_14520, partial [Micropruina sp.]|uniref:hypothetical protein n=1 Tax=Micropruina sp. TaxID=2737536 RepID=UPI0039E585BD
MSGRTVRVQTRDAAWQSPIPTRTGVVWEPTHWDVEVSDEPRPARPGHSRVVAVGGGRPETWDGRHLDEWLVLVDAGTDSGMRAHPIAGVDRMSA